MDDEKTRVLVFAREEDRRSWGKVHNPDDGAYPKEQKSLFSLRVSEDEFNKILNGDYSEIERLKKTVRDYGYSGKVNVRVNHGGLGKKPRWKTKRDWKTSRESGFKKIMEMDV